jgi:hypothetical protein
MPCISELTPSRSGGLSFSAAEIKVSSIYVRAKFMFMKADGEVGEVGNPVQYGYLKYDGTSRIHSFKNPSQIQWDKPDTFIHSRIHQLFMTSKLRVTRHPWMGLPASRVKA